MHVCSVCAVTHKYLQYILILITDKYWYIGERNEWQVLTSAKATEDGQVYNINKCNNSIVVNIRSMAWHT